MTGQKYVLSLREDMPPGFIANERYPLLPKMTEYLRQFDGKSYPLDEFRDIIIAFMNKVDKELVDNSFDDGMKSGLKVKEMLDGNYLVYCEQDGPARECHFGTLDKLVKN